MSSETISYPKGGFPKLMYKSDNLDDTIKLTKKREFDNKTIISINTILNTKKLENDESLLFLKRPKDKDSNKIKKSKKKTQKETEDSKSDIIDFDIDTNQYKNKINLADINKPIDIKRIIKSKKSKRKYKSKNKK